MTNSKPTLETGALEIFSISTQSGVERAENAMIRRFWPKESTRLLKPGVSLNDKVRRAPMPSGIRAKVPPRVWVV